VHPDKEAAIQCILCLRCKVDTKKSYHCSPECLREHWAFHRDFHQQSRENGAPPRQPPRVRCTWR
jgi:CCR4-NOT transcription complex subunit 6